jgi:hypothetical protein
MNPRHPLISYEALSHRVAVVTQNPLLLLDETPTSYLSITIFAIETFWVPSTARGPDNSAVHYELVALSTIRCKQLPEIVFAILETTDIIMFQILSERLETLGTNETIQVPVLVLTCACHLLIVDECSIATFTAQIGPCHFLVCHCLSGGM